MALSYNTIFGKALHFPGAISAPADLIASAELQEWVNNSATKKVENCRFNTTDSSLIGEVAALLNSYAAAVGATALMGDEDLNNTQLMDLEVSKYLVGSEFKNHQDTNTSEEETPGVVTAVVALNDNHGGGEFGFVDVDGEVSLAAGDAIVFPSYLSRYTTLVEDSNKYYLTINFTLDV